MSQIKSLKAGTQVLDRDHCPVAFTVVDIVPEVPKGKTIQAEIYKVGQPIGAEFQAIYHNFPISCGFIDGETGEYVPN